MANEALGVSGIGSLQDTRSLEVDAFGASEVNGGWGVEADTRMAVVVVVPSEEALAEGAAIFNAAEAVGELWSVLEGLELCLEIGACLDGAESLGELRCDQRSNLHLAERDEEDTVRKGVLNLKTKVQPHCVSDDLGREAITAIGPLSGLGDRHQAELISDPRST